MVPKTRRELQDGRFHPGHRRVRPRPNWRRPGQGLKTRQIAAYSVSGAPRSGALTDDSDEVDAADESDAAVA